MTYKTMKSNNMRWNYKVRNYIAEWSYLMTFIGNVKQVISKPCLSYFDRVWPSKQ